MRFPHEATMSIAARELAQSIWFLVGQIDETGPSRCIPIHSTPFLVGRRPDLALHLPRPTASTVHAELRIDNGALILRDLKSTNGTYVNGYRIEGEVCLGEEDLVQFADIAFRIRRQVAGNTGRTICEDVVDHALALVQFDKLMRERAVMPAFQPIVELDTLRAIGHEVLGRSNLVGLETPQAMFQAASRLDLEMELSRMLRWEGIRVGASVPALEHLFVNTHPHELGRPELLASLRTTRDANRTLALTLEIHEAAVTDLAMMRELRVELTKLNIGLAFDDFGAGQARLVELIEVKPDYLKFDMRLIRGIDQAAASRQQVLATLVKMSHNVGSKPLAEGVETAGEHETCREMGFELGQGFFYGKPAPSTLYDNALLAR
jgi:EAL domain-containing protein (putative c-di-GMP-specific phosphodiesterase class I)